MQKLIVFTEDEFNQKLIEFAKNFKEQSDKFGGVILASNYAEDILNDPEIMDSIESISASLYIPWNKTFSLNKE